MLFDYSSGISETFKRKGGYLPGNIAKTGWFRVESVNSNSPAEPIEFGQVVKRLHEATPRVVAIEEDELPPRFFGVAVNDVKTETIVDLKLAEPRYVKQYFSGNAISVMTEGWICVPVQNGTPVIGDPVYVRIKPSATNASLPLGGIETAGVGCVAWKGATFESEGFYPFKGTKNGTDSDGVTAKCAIIHIEEERYGMPLTLVSAPNDVTAVYGTLPKDITLTGGSVQYEGEEVEGEFRLNNPTQLYDVGEHEVTCTFYPNSGEFEALTDVELTLTITKATLTLDVAPVASSISKGDTLSDSRLSGGSVSFNSQLIAGTWSWDEPETVVTETDDFKAVFTPTVGADNFNELSEDIEVVALDNNTNITSVTVKGENAVEDENGDWLVTLASGVTFISADEIVVVPESATTEVTLVPDHFVNIPETGSLHSNMEIIAEDLTHVTKSILITIM